MKRFRFPLENARLFREQQLDAVERKLELLVRERRSIEDRHKALLVERAEEERILFTSAYAEAAELARLDRFRLFVRAEEARLALSARDCDQRVARQREQVIEVRRQFELINHLREKSMAAWRANYNKEQEDLAADLYLASHRRR